MSSSGSKPQGPMTVGKETATVVARDGKQCLAMEEVEANATATLGLGQVVARWRSERRRCSS
jgi:hypothetical protein